MSTLIFLTQGVLAYAPESSFWSERRRAAHPRRFLEDSIDPALADQLAREPRLYQLIRSIQPFGRLNSVQISSSVKAPLVIHIQDVHGNIDAQKNMAEMVLSLSRSLDLQLVGLEGASGRFSTEEYKAYSDREAVKEAAFSFMKRDLIGGPEYAALASEKNLTLWGIEDPALYRANVTAVIDSISSRPMVKRYLASLERDLAQMKKIHYTREENDFDENRSSFDCGRRGLGEYVHSLAGWIGTDRSMLDKFSQVAGLIRALDEEKRLDLREVEEEKNRLIRHLSSKLSPTDVEDFLCPAGRPGDGQLDPADKVQALMHLCDRAGLNRSDYPAFNAYVNYRRLTNGLQPGSLSKEVKAFSDTIEECLAKTPEQKKIVEFSRAVSLLRKLFSIEMTPDDWAAYSKKLRSSLSRPHCGAGHASEIVKPYEDFFSRAVERNGALTQRLMEKMTRDHQSAAILVAGGFHSEGLASQLTGRGASVIVITPTVGDHRSTRRYLDGFTRKPLRADQISSDETATLKSLCGLSASPETAGIRQALHELINNIIRKKNQENPLLERKYSRFVIHLLVALRNILFKFFFDREYPTAQNNPDGHSQTNIPRRTLSDADQAFIRSVLDAFQDGSLSSVKIDFDAREINYEDAMRSLDAICRKVSLDSILGLQFIEFGPSQTYADDRFRYGHIENFPGVIALLPKSTLTPSELNTIRESYRAIKSVLGRCFVEMTLVDNISLNSSGKNPEGGAFVILMKERPLLSQDMTWPTPYEGNGNSENSWARELIQKRLLAIVSLKNEFTHLGFHYTAGSRDQRDFAPRNGHLVGVNLQKVSVIPGASPRYNPTRCHDVFESDIRRAQAQWLLNILTSPKPGSIVPTADVVKFFKILKIENKKLLSILVGLSIGLFIPLAETNVYEFVTHKVLLLAAADAAGVSLGLTLLTAGLVGLVSASVHFLLWKHRGESVFVRDFVLWWVLAAGYCLPFGLLSSSGWGGELPWIYSAVSHIFINSLVLLGVTRKWGSVLGWGWLKNLKTSSFFPHSDLQNLGQFINLAVLSKMKPNPMNSSETPQFKGELSGLRQIDQEWIWDFDYEDFPLTLRVGYGKTFEDWLSEQTSMLLKTKGIAHTQQLVHFELKPSGYSYLVTSFIRGAPFDSADPSVTIENRKQNIQNLPPKHVKDLLTTVFSLLKVGWDPSKGFRLFYDTEAGFTLADLTISPTEIHYDSGWVRDQAFEVTALALCGRNGMADDVESDLLSEAKGKIHNSLVQSKIQFSDLEYDSELGVYVVEDRRLNSLGGKSFFTIGDRIYMSKGGYQQVKNGDRAILLELEVEKAWKERHLALRVLDSPVKDTADAFAVGTLFAQLVANYRIFGASALDRDCLIRIVNLYSSTNVSDESPLSNALLATAGAVAAAAIKSNAFVTNDVIEYLKRATTLNEVLAVNSDIKETRALYTRLAHHFIEKEAPINESALLDLHVKFLAFMDSRKKSRAPAPAATTPFVADDSATPRFTPQKESPVPGVLPLDLFETVRVEAPSISKAYEARRTYGVRGDENLTAEKLRRFREFLRHEVRHREKGDAVLKQGIPSNAFSWKDVALAIAQGRRANGHLQDPWRSWALMEIGLAAVTPADWLNWRTWVLLYEEKKTFGFWHWDSREDRLTRAVVLAALLRGCDNSILGDPRTDSRESAQGWDIDLIFGGIGASSRNWKTRLRKMTETYNEILGQAARVDLWRETARAKSAEGNVLIIDIDALMPESKASEEVQREVASALSGVLLAWPKEKLGERVYLVTSAERPQGPNTPPSSHVFAQELSQRYGPLFERVKYLRVVSPTDGVEGLFEKKESQTTVHMDHLMNHLFPVNKPLSTEVWTHAAKRVDRGSMTEIVITDIMVFSRELLDSLRQNPFIKTFA